MAIRHQYLACLGAAALLGASISVVSCSSGKSSEPDTSATVELVAALKQRSIPGLPDPLTHEKAVEIERMRTGPGGWFVQKGCFACHSVSVYGVTSVTQTGPDLSTAVEDVKSRFGKPIEEFLKEPVGTMTFVLSSYIPLTPEEKAVALQKLREAYAEHERREEAREKGGGEKNGGHDKTSD